MNSKKNIEKRKLAHLEKALDPRSQAGPNGLEIVSLPFISMPDSALEDIDTATTFLGKKISYPFFISCMTGGPEKTRIINLRLAKTAQKFNIPMGLGSIGIALKYPELAKTFAVRDVAPDIPLMANLGASSLNYGFTWKDCQKAIDITGADALVLHLNALQESLQPGGSTNFKGLLPKIASLVKKLKIPLIIKEVGHGIDGKTAQRLFDSGVEIIDTAGVGGTSWAWIEAEISKEHQTGEVFKRYGLTTYDSIVSCSKVKGLIVLGSGGIRTGLDIARVMFLGCKLAGIAHPFLVASMSSENDLDFLCYRLIRELRIALFMSGGNKKNTL